MKLPSPRPVPALRRYLRSDGEVTGPILALLGFTYSIPRNHHPTQQHQALLRPSTFRKDGTRLHSTVAGRRQHSTSYQIVDQQSAPDAQLAITDPPQSNVKDVAHIKHEMQSDGTVHLRRVRTDGGDLPYENLTEDGWNNLHCKPTCEEEEHNGRLHWKLHISKLRGLVKQYLSPDSRPSKDIKHKIATQAKYVGKAQSMVLSTGWPRRSSTSIRVPWDMTRRGRAGRSGLEVLDEEIRLFTEHMQLTRGEQAARLRVTISTRALIQDCLERLGQICDVALSGSTETGLAVSSSDIDFVLTRKSGSSQAQTALSRGDLPRELTALSRRGSPRELHMATVEVWKSLLKHPDYICVVQHRYTRLRTVTAQHKESGLDIQLVCNAVVAPQIKATRAYLEHNPHLKSVFTVLRTVLETRGMLDTHNGSVSSYILLNMIVAALHRRTPAACDAESAAHQLLHVLDFYASLDTSRTGIRIRDGGLYAKLSRSASPVSTSNQTGTDELDLPASPHHRDDLAEIMPYVLSMTDPAVRNRNIARDVFAIKHIQATFAFLNAKLRKGISEIDAAYTAGTTWEKGRLMDHLVGPVHVAQRDLRLRLNSYATNRINTSQDK